MISSIFFCIVAQAQDFELYTLKNGQGISMAVTNYGARIVSLRVPDRHGNYDDIVCGFDTIGSYARYKQNYGAVVGRYIGRILGAKFSLDGRTYHLGAEKNGHYSHGVKPGFANVFWTVESRTDSTLSLQYVSPDGESGFPGELKITVIYTLTDANELAIHYSATTDRPTVLNPSNHSFFNISGDFSSTVLDQHLQIDADSIALYDETKCVTGKLMSVSDSPFDFRCPATIGKHIDDDHPQLKVTGGYDHAFRLNHPGDINRVAARIHDDKSGRTMEVYTTEPALQIYTANGLKANVPGKNGIRYARRTAICFETMHFPDSPNKPHWPSTVLRPGQTFNSTTVFKFLFY